VTVIEVRRADDEELCGYVAAVGGTWQSMTVFGGVLGTHDERDGAIRHVLDVGLASLAERWILVDVTTGEDQIVCIQEASPEGVTLALDYYSLPGVPSLALTTEDLLGDRWQLRRS
jgi:hypothetical protein